MHTAKKNTIDWNSPDALEQLAQHIRNPLQSIINVSKTSTACDPKNIEKILFSSSKEINDIVEDILAKVRTNTLSLTYHDRPDIFHIYESNENVRKMCTGELQPQKVAKIDQNWLVGLEREVYGNINQEYLDLNELSYKMAVSERQLHRKVANLVFLTPNKYVRILRLHRARQLIDSYVQQSVSQVAYTVGYKDVHYFSKLFAEQYSISPKQLLGSFR
ncbi:helix-turn-helix transcriptional regulator [Spirosoma sordidisoli]|uniref:Helix-turn-helix domain-containing protein n=1 Tax=Spirosoma sordidisoli TaxID=2502893 RepID=A0A4Q2UJR5_9BACT|nr:helix-turn-helix transcriptional regulator [Spirosoma sordidisoli]RYC66999.1 helix-turn-helix domain-containing protein [Spirosoma sordidisoli]